MITITSYLGWSSRASASIVSPRTSCSWRAGNSNENDRGAPAARRRKPVAANASGLRHACSIHHRVVPETVNNPSDRTTSTPLRRSCDHDSGRFSLCSRGVGCAGGSVPPEKACTPWAGGRAPPDEPSGCAPGVPGETAPDGCCCSVAADDPAPLAEGTDGCAGLSSPPKGCPLKTTNATKRRTAPNATAVRLIRSRQRVASSTVTASCSAASFCCLGRRGGTEGLTAPLRSRAALSTGRARRTTSPPRPRARRGSCGAAWFCCLGRRGGAEGLTGAVVSPPRSVAQCSQHRDLVAQWCQPRARESPHASAPAQPRAAKHRSAVSAAAPTEGSRSGSPPRSARAVVSPPRSSRAVVSTGRAR